MPGDGSVNIVKQPFAHHKRFAGTAFLAWAAVKTHGAARAILFKPVFHRYRASKGRRTQQVVAAAVAVSIFNQRLG
ncbi:hypothetical protein D3C75_948190 [compost metagenome]